jgi:hypothetical protein
VLHFAGRRPGIPEPIAGHAGFSLKPSLTADFTIPEREVGELMFTQRSLTGRIKGLRYAVGPNDFKFAQRLRTALVRAILDRSPVGPAEPVSTAETHRLMLAADRASARIAKWEKQPEPDPRAIAFWPADFVEGGQFLAPALCKTENRFSELVGSSNRNAAFAQVPSS